MILRDTAMKFEVELDDYEHVRDAIESTTQALSGVKLGRKLEPGEKDLNVYSEEIDLTIYSHRVVNLLMIDLPGMTRFPAPGQDKNIQAGVGDSHHHHATQLMRIIVGDNTQPRQEVHLTPKHIDTRHHSNGTGLLHHRDCCDCS